MTHWMQGDWPDTGEEGDWPDAGEDSVEVKAMKRLLKIAKVVNDRCVIADDPEDAILIEFYGAIEEAESILFPEDDDPRSMGWVDDRGLP